MQLSLVHQVCAQCPRFPTFPGPVAADSECRQVDTWPGQTTLSCTTLPTSRSSLCFMGQRLEEDVVRLWDYNVVTETDQILKLFFADAIRGAGNVLQLNFSRVWNPVDGPDSLHRVDLTGLSSVVISERYHVRILWRQSTALHIQPPHFFFLCVQLEVLQEPCHFLEVEKVRLNQPLNDVQRCLPLGYSHGLCPLACSLL